MDSKATFYAEEEDFEKKKAKGHIASNTQDLQYHEL